MSQYKNNSQEYKLNQCNKNKIDCHMCQTQYSTNLIAICSKRSCKKAFCQRCIKRNYDENYNIQKNYKKDFFICYVCQNKCKCSSCNGYRTISTRKCNIDSLFSQSQPQTFSQKSSKIIKKITRNTSFKTITTTNSNNNNNKVKRQIHGDDDSEEEEEFLMYLQKKKMAKIQENIGNSSCLVQCCDESSTQDSFSHHNNNQINKSNCDNEDNQQDKRNCLNYNNNCQQQQSKFCSNSSQFQNQSILNSNRLCKKIKDDEDESSISFDIVRNDLHEQNYKEQQQQLENNNKELLNLKYHTQQQQFENEKIELKKINSINQIDLNIIHPNQQQQSLSINNYVLECSDDSEEEVICSKVLSFSTKIKSIYKNKNKNYPNDYNDDKHKLYKNNNNHNNSIKKQQK